MSDVDIVLPGPCEKAHAITLDGMDRLDILCIPKEAPDRLLMCRSPESGFLDALPIHGGSPSTAHYKSFNTRQNLLNKFIWSYKYSRVFDDRSTNHEINLKYSPGCYRDVLFIDHLARFLNGRWPSGLDGSAPEIIGATTQVCKYIGTSAPPVLESIAFVMLVKSTVLQAHASTPHRGRTQLNEETLSHALQCNNLLATTLKAKGGNFWAIYQQSRNNLKRVLKTSFTRVLCEYPEMIYDDISIALKAANGQCVGPLETLLDNPQWDTFPIAVCILAEKTTTATTIRRMAERYHADPGQQYTNRLIAKSPLTNKDTLVFMRDNAKFAFDAWTQSRYTRLIEERLHAK